MNNNEESLVYQRAPERWKLIEQAQGNYDWTRLDDTARFISMSSLLEGQYEPEYRVWFRNRRSGKLWWRHFPESPELATRG